jgi:hypothetical protein
MRYSPSTKAFYAEAFDYGANLPGDLIDIGDDYHGELLAAQDAGKMIVPGNDGVPVAVDQPPASAAEVRAQMRLSFAQLLIGLDAEAWITTAEADAWLTGTLPAPVTALIVTLPAPQQFPARARALRPTVVERADPLVGLLAAAQGKTDADLDTFFLTYAQV